MLNDRWCRDTELGWSLSVWNATLNQWIRRFSVGLHGITVGRHTQKLYKDKFFVCLCVCLSKWAVFFFFFPRFVTLLLVRVIWFEMFLTRDKFVWRPITLRCVQMYNIPLLPIMCHTAGIHCDTGHVKMSFHWIMFTLNILKTVRGTCVAQFVCVHNELQ